MAIFISLAKVVVCKFDKFTVRCEFKFFSAYEVPEVILSFVFIAVKRYL